MSEPTGNADVVRVATPPEMVAVPIAVAPLKKVTVPEGAVLPLVARTADVSVTVEPWVRLDDEAERDVVVLLTPGFGVTVKLNVALCTRSPLMPHRVTGTVCEAEVEDAVRLRTDAPEPRLGLLKEAETPAGKPETLRLTVP
jgi:hypothetical protein